MSEPVTFHVFSDQDFDGQTVSALKLTDFTRIGRREFRIELADPLGVVTSTVFEMFSSDAPKLIGVASRHYNPRSVLRVVPPNAGVDEYREEVDLTPTVQYVVMEAGDSLAIVTEDDGRTAITIVANELSEDNHVQWAIANSRSRHWRRFRIIRDDPAGFKPGFNAAQWKPAFFWQAASFLSLAQEVAKGPIPVSSLCTFPRFAACLLRVRYANIASSGKLHILEPVTKSHRVHDGAVPNMQWSKTLSVSHDDNICLDSGDPASDNRTICDIEVQRIPPIRLLLGKYNRGE
ncbi:MAG: hypothetical protein ACPG4T_09955 [Nannocystaceae bacterium]